MLLHFFVHRRKSCTFVPSKTERFMDRIRLKDKEFELFIPESDIQAAIAKMAVQIKADVEGKNPLFVGVLNGAFMFVAELMRELDVPYELTFARYSSYQGTSSTGILNEIMPVQADIRGRMVILLEDRYGLYDELRDGEASERGCRRCKIGNDAFQAGILEMRVDSGLCRLTDTR